MKGGINRIFYSNENTTMRYQCRVSPASNITWYFQSRFGEQTPLLIEQYDGSLDMTIGTTAASVNSWSMATDHTAPLFTWTSVKSIKERYILVENENLTISIAANDNYTWHKAQGKYTCAADTECGPMNTSVTIKPAGKFIDTLHIYNLSTLGRCNYR